MIVLLQDFKPTIRTGIKLKLQPTTVDEIFKQCFEKYFETLYHYAFSIVKDNAEAKDIVQTAFVKLWEKKNEVDLKTACRSYLYTSVYRLSLNSIRNRKIRELHHKGMSPSVPGTSMNSAEVKERRSRIESAIQSLPERCRQVFSKSRMEGKKYAIIATEMDISIKTVEVQMGKALKILREQLADLIVAFFIYLIIHQPA